MKIDVSPEVHKALSIAASLRGVTAKALADEILSSAIDSEVWALVRKSESTDVKMGFCDISPPKEDEYHRTDGAESTEVQKAKAYILAELEAGREPTVAEVAAFVKMESRPLGRLLKAEGIEAKNTRRGGAPVRCYTIDAFRASR